MEILDNVLRYSFAKQKAFLFDTSHELKTPLTTMRLAIVKRIVEIHGGKVKFESQQGSWTRVTVCLPGHLEMASA